ncbi:cupin [Streptomyces chartreusis]|uniref:cupin n=1 Tax=Streptomyces chartreusis TaxID=1969 RepID=UPI0034285508
MSYPKRVYDGDGGEINAGFRPADTLPNVGTAGADAIHYLATTTTRRGEFGLYRVEMSARAGGPKTHFHRTIWVDAPQGDFLHVPQGGLHPFRNDSDTPAEMERARFFDEHDSYFVE